MVPAKLFKIGHGVVVTIPKGILAALGLRRGDYVMIEQAEPRAFTVRPLRLTPDDRASDRASRRRSPR